MAIWSNITAPNLADFIEALNGAQVGTVNLSNGADVDGLEFIVDTTSTPRTVTFSPAKSRPWTAAEIVAQINAAHADLADVAHVKVSSPGTVPQQWLSIWKDGGATVKKTGTANTLLGFSTAADQVQAVVVDTTIEKIDRDTSNQGTWVALLYQ